MSSLDDASSRQPPNRDHRVALAAEKRQLMRARILEATLRVFGNLTDGYPVVEDVVRDAKVSRGTFYKYFKTLDEALIAAGTDASDQMMVDMLPVYDFLAQPWQRFSVGFRLYLIRALADRRWARFITRMDVWPLESLVAHYMSDDLRRGHAAGQFQFDDLNATADLLMGGCAGCIHAIRRGVSSPQAYLDACVGLGLQTLGCSADLRHKAVEFSREHLAPVMTGELRIWKPL